MSLILSLLDVCLIRDYADFIPHPCSIKNGEIFNAEGKVVKCFPEVNAVFEKLKNFNIKTAICQNCKKVNETFKLIDLFGWNKYVSYIELNPGVEVDHLIKIQEKSGVSFNETILFTDNPLLEDAATKDLGIFSVFVPIGMKMELLDKALSEYESKQNTSITTEKPECTENVCNVK